MTSTGLRKGGDDATEAETTATLTSGGGGEAPGPPPAQAVVDYRFRQTARPVAPITIKNHAPGAGIVVIGGKVTFGTSGPSPSG